MAKQQEVVEEITAKYHMYADGSSYWGIALFRNGETPIATTKEMHQNKNIEGKIAWYKEATTKKDEVEAS